MKLYKPAALFYLFLATSYFLQAQSSTDTTQKILVEFQRVEVEASFPGGIPGWQKYLMKNLNPNVPVDNGAPSGKFTVLVQFVVSKDGTVSSIKPLTEFGYGMEQEVVRIIGNSGKWMPALQNGRAVNAYRRQPVSFIIEQEDNYRIITDEPYSLKKGVDNNVIIEIKRVKNENLTVSASHAGITQLEPGRYSVKPDGSGRVLITVYNKSNSRQICAASYDVQ